MKTPALLVIMDGFGIAEHGPGNAVGLADKPYLDHLFTTRPTIKIAASGPDVGLPEGQMGNSEVGHLNMGAGRIVNQDLQRINMSVKSGEIYENQVLINAIDSAVSGGHAVHCMGLLSDGGVHSEMTHCMAVMEMACRRGAKDVCVHGFLDGRDVPPRSATEYITEMEECCQRLSEQYDADVRIASIAGRAYSMDRDNRWERVAKGWETLVHAGGDQGTSALAILNAAYEADLVDEYLVPSTVAGRHPGIQDGDAVIFYNFRPDRAREMTYCFVKQDFDGFDRGRVPKVAYVCMTTYDEDLDVPVAYPKVLPEYVLADFLAEQGISQFHIAETEKYAHVTFFFNGGVEAEKEGEKRCLIPSPREVPTYDLKPQMSAPEVTEALVSAIENDEADVYIVNFANCDMVGHTGVIDAARQAVEAVDKGVQAVVSAIERKGGVALVTADHGNAEKMIDDDGVTPWTAHTCSLVPFCIAAGEATFGDYEDGRLADVAPTFVTLMGLTPPDIWTGRSLLA